MTLNKTIFFFFAATMAMFTACEDPIDVSLPDGQSQLVVDALITTEPGQEIILTRTLPYFDQESNPPATGANVYIVNREDDIQLPFIESEFEPGVYKTELGISGTGADYDLYVEYQNEMFKASTSLAPVPPIDTLIFYNDDFDGTGEEVLIAEFFATDIAGSNDYYWIQYTRNDTLFSDPSDLNLTQNGSFGLSGTGEVDGILFIIPIRTNINSWDSPYIPGDNLDLELRSVTADCFDFLTVVQTQADNVNQGLFAIPPANIPSNILNINSDSNEKALGFFCLSNVSKRFAIVPEQ